MDSGSNNSSPQPVAQASDVEPPEPAVNGGNNSALESLSVSSSPSKTSGATSSKLPQPIAPEGMKTGAAGLSTFSRFTNGLGLHFPSKPSGAEEIAESTSDSAQAGIFESFTKGLFDTSKNAVKAVQVKARHVVSQNKRRYQEGGFDLDMTYITDNIVAMGFPAGDLSSGIFGFLEGFYRNHIEEVIKFFETHHKGKYKVYNLCSERLYDASLFEGKVASFPFDDHNCPPLELIKLFCQSAYSWLKEDIQNVIVVHCKAGMGRTGLMICSLLLFLKFFPTVEEAIDYFNKKRCVDGKALVLPSQIRYVKYFDRILTQFNGENQPGRRCMLRGFRLHKCPYWIRPSITISNHTGVLFSTKKHPKTKDLKPEDFWIRAPKKGIVVFAIPGEPGLTELVGDFKIHFHDRQGDFYCWLNTTMTENRFTLDGSDLDGFEKRNLPSPGFQVEVVMIDYDGIRPTTSKADSVGKVSDSRSSYAPVQSGGIGANSNQNKVPVQEDNDDVFSDSDGEQSGASKGRKPQAASEVIAGQPHHVPNARDGKLESLTHGTEQLSLGREASSKPASGLEIPSMGSVGASDIKAIAADASVFSFGDEEDYESD
ncbi:Phosphatidylinositol-3 4 5-trisphosphate 3-phosphatase [Tripterygium wilfordii]|uniref:Phosphatidylinositol-3 4 5-trisphosphate 3-phosphatase n=1 Tax=Tripterygium wilfordii TaxID=458696 RepID=A0A7J7CVV3_TRIWF|nr:phosphatidylinositol 3,4,5-trisphosphate 3-phosphatase and protein-tyrosine-phosphatase PTEN2A-like [Tripterygium wilfordii]XP_038718767.1 phosphatidylinositol 3,4,5-trisphosphate 3-phosphatase and protein-tyrosine-phosphatase PTEN2A-like [Tripterygium wilfordii]XP_038718768.1 phosphatidylinositol 3,4,5-trisphosphate 3-phosphatase and protein-tyrosine-phosphatase PTEN2A-like [Tripterygium wilfordii]XP_038718769.1 phosphatidylinositol 3,4,5-trisphosphate 3-phosphatase and protein-tyrosine-phos